MRRIVHGTLALYALGVLAVTLLPIRPHPADYWAGEPFARMVHLVPGDVDWPSFILNVIMFIPFGVLLPLFHPAADRYGRIASLAVTASALIELAQLTLGLTLGSRRTVDVNDLIANLAGALLGLLILRLAVPAPAHRELARSLILRSADRDPHDES